MRSVGNGDRVHAGVGRELEVDEAEPLRRVPQRVNVDVRFDDAVRSHFVLRLRGRRVPRTRLGDCAVGASAASAPFVAICRR